MPKGPHITVGFQTTGLTLTPSRAATKPATTPIDAPASVPAGEPDPHNARHPGVLVENWVKASPLGVMPFADHIGVKRNALYKLFRGEMPISAAMALRLAQAFGNSPMFWMNLQAQYDLKVARVELGEGLAAITSIASAPEIEQA